MDHPNFDISECISRIRSKDAMTFEDAFDELHPIASHYISELIAELETADDAYTRGKFLELLGFSHSDSVIPILSGELDHPDQNVRQWAILALEEINSPSSLSKATAYKASHPGEFAS